MSGGIGNRIKELRISKGYTQKALAKKLLVTPMAISQWEANKTEPKGSNLRTLCSIFNVSLEWLSTGVMKGDVSVDNDLCTVSIPFSGVQQATKSKLNSHIVIDSRFFNGIDFHNLLCVEVVGDAMEPLLTDSSVVIIDSADTVIKDGKLYVIKQSDRLFVKILSYTSTGVRLKSFNVGYKDEIYTFQELAKLEIFGKVIYQITAR